jgi:hypothetical protein
LQSEAAADWCHFKTAVFEAAAKTTGFKRRNHKDWFNDNDSVIAKLLDDMHVKHLAWINDKGDSARKLAYNLSRNAAQQRLRLMKETWWKRKADELQEAADRHDMRTFYDGLKAIYGPRDSGTIPILAADGSTMITDRTGILNRWAEHFEGVLNQASHFDETVLNEIPDWEIDERLMEPPDVEEVTRAINQLSAGKAAGADGLPPEIFKAGSPVLVES